MMGSERARIGSRGLSSPANWTGQSGSDFLPSVRCLLLLLVATVSASCSAPAQHVNGKPEDDWEASVGEIAAACDEIVLDPMVQPVAALHREEAVAMLATSSSRGLSEKEAARLIEVPYQDGQSLATALAARFADALRQRKHRAEVERRDSWSLADQNTLQAIEAAFANDAGQDYRPYLIRAVSKGDREPVLVADYCNRELRVVVVTPVSSARTTRWPTIVFLPHAPQKALAYVSMFE